MQSILIRFFFSYPFTARAVYKYSIYAHHCMSIHEYLTHPVMKQDRSVSKSHGARFESRGIRTLLAVTSAVAFNHAAILRADLHAILQGRFPAHISGARARCTSSIRLSILRRAHCALVSFIAFPIDNHHPVLEMRKRARLCGIREKYINDI